MTAKPFPIMAATAAAGVTLLALGAVLKTAQKSKSYSFRGKTVAITGGSRGLGLALAREFLSQGARVAILGRDQGTLDRAMRSLSDGGAVIAARCDVTDQHEVIASLASIRKNFGAIDVLINNAGIISVGPMDSMTIDDYRQSLLVHFWAPLYTTFAVLPEMRRRGEGRIVNISSIGGKISVPHLLPYSAGKFALAGFSEGLRTEVAKDNILVTSVYPGLMRTGSPRNALFKGRNHAEHTWFSLSDSLPGLSISADTAARQIVNACRLGKPHLIISLPAKLGIKLHQTFPATSASVLELVNRILPSSGGIGTRGKTGRQSKSRLSPSWMTILDEFAARKNNEVAV